MSPVAINGVDKQGVSVNGVQVKQALSAASETVVKGVFDETTLSAVDTDLATANIKATVTIFGKAGKAEVVDTTTATPIAAARMKTGDEGWANGVKYTGTGTKTLNPANETVAAGYYAATTLSAVDAQLAVANIKQGVNIFGFVGTLPAGGVETVTKHADAVIANNATYTPGVSGIFFCGRIGFANEYFSTADANWHQKGNKSQLTGFTAIGDGTNFRIKNGSGGNQEYILMRHYISTGTYERARDEDLASGVNWTPATAGFFDVASEESVEPNIQLNMTTAGWIDMMLVQGETQASTISIGDGTNLRIHNSDGSARYHITMRAKMT